MTHWSEAPAEQSTEKDTRAPQSGDTIRATFVGKLDEFGSLIVDGWQFGANRLQAATRIDIIELKASE